MNKTLYDQDYYLWLEHTTQLLKQGKFSGVDIPNLIDEIEGMGKSQKQALKSNLRVVLMHLLKYQYQPEKRSNSWKYSIREHKNCLHDQFEDSPVSSEILMTYFSSVMQMLERKLPTKRVYL